MANQSAGHANKKFSTNHLLLKQAKEKRFFLLNDEFAAFCFYYGLRNKIQTRSRYSLLKCLNYVVYTRRIYENTQNAERWAE